MPPPRPPAWFEPSDEFPASDEIYKRDTRSDTQIGLLVRGTYDHTITLGIAAVRCIRGGKHGYIPVGMALADSPFDLDTSDED